MALTPKNWATFQHYKKRSPPWIKLHRALLDDYVFHCLQPASRALAPCLWLLASEYPNGCITASLTELSFRLRTSAEELIEAIKPLIDCGFFTGDILDASMMLADCKHGSPVEKRRERVDIGRAAPSPQIASTSASDWPPDWHNRFWTAYPLKVGKKSALKRLDEVRKRKEVAFDDLMEALQRYAAKTDDRPFCHPITWINQGRWTDDPASNRKERGNGKLTVHEAADDLLNRLRALDSDSGGGESQAPPRRLPSQ